MKSFLFHKFVDFLSSHDELKEVHVPVTPRVDISKDFFPLSLREYKILRKCLNYYLGSLQHLASSSSEYETDLVVLLIVKLTKAFDHGDFVDDL